MQSFLKQPSNFFNKTKIGANSLLSSGKKLGSTLMGTPIKVAQKLLPPTKQLAKERRQNDSSQFVKNYLDFFGAKKTAKVLRNNLKITRDALVDMFETTKLLKIQVGNITDSLKMKGGKKKGGLLSSIFGLKIGAALLAALPFILKLGAIGSLVGIGVALLNSPKFREAFFKFMTKFAEVIWNTLKPVAVESLKFLFGETEYSKEVKQSLNPKVINANIKEQGAEKTLDMMREQYAKDKESGFLDSFRAKRDGIEDEYIRRMTDVERKLSKEQGTKNIVSIMEKEIQVKTKEIKKERNNPPTNSEDKRDYDNETKRLIKEAEKNIREKYKQILVKGAAGGSIDESVSGMGEKYKGSTAFDKPIKEVSDSKVEGVKEGDIENVKGDTSKNMNIVKNIENAIEEESDDPIIEYVPTAMSGSNNQPQVMRGSSDTSPAGGGSPSIVFFPSKNFDTISDQTAKSLMNIVDG